MGVSPPGLHGKNDARSPRYIDGVGPASLHVDGRRTALEVDSDDEVDGDARLRIAGDIVVDHWHAGLRQKAGRDSCVCSMHADDISRGLGVARGRRRRGAVAQVDKSAAGASAVRSADCVVTILWYSYRRSCCLFDSEH